MLLKPFQPTYWDSGCGILPEMDGIQDLPGGTSPLRYRSIMNISSKTRVRVDVTVGRVDPYDIHIEPINDMEYQCLTEDQRLTLIVSFNVYRTDDPCIDETRCYDRIDQFDGWYKTTPYLGEAIEIAEHLATLIQADDEASIREYLTEQHFWHGGCIYS